MTAPIRRRTRAREIAVQVLFQFDLRGQHTASDGKHQQGGPQGKEPQAKEPQAKEPQGREPQGRDPQGRDPQGRDPQGRDPQAKEPRAAEPLAEAMGGTIAQLCRAELFVDAEGEQLEQPDKLGAADREVVEFAARLVEGAIHHREAIDQRLQSVTRNWDLKRMAVVDRNVLRMAVYELLHCDDVPPKVAINEAIEIGKKYSTANSGGFVNGILDRIRIDIEQERKQQRKQQLKLPNGDRAPGEATGGRDGAAQGDT